MNFYWSSRFHFAVLIVSSNLGAALLQDGHATIPANLPEHPFIRELRPVNCQGSSLPSQSLIRTNPARLPARDDSDEDISYCNEEDIEYLWTLPDAFGDHSYFERFTPAEAPFRLIGLRIVLHNLFGNAGHPDMRVSIATSDRNLPDDEIESFVVPTEDLVLSPNGDWFWNEYLFDEYGVGAIRFEEAVDFHLIINIAPNNDEDTLALVTDDGRRRIDRSGLFDGMDSTYVLFRNLQGVRISVNFALVAIVEYGDAPVRQVISLREGWNTISLNVSPTAIDWIEDLGPDPRGMIQQFRIDDEHHHVIMLKDRFGQFCSPQDDVWDIPYWNLSDGYQIKVDEPLRGSWTGTAIDPQSPLPLAPGWNMVPYYPEYELSAASPEFEVVSSILDQLIVVKDDAGNFMLPSLNFSNMADWQPGKGYQIKVDADCDLTYPGDEGRTNSPRSADAPKPIHWSLEAPSSDNMLLLINSFGESLFVDGDEIGAFDSQGSLVGSGVIVEGRCGLALWGEDPSGTVKDGLTVGEEPSFRLWRSERSEESSLLIKDSQHGKPIRYARNDVVVGSAVIVEALPERSSLTSVHPNPFNSFTLIEYLLAESGIVTIVLCDTQGRIVAQIFEGNREAGRYMERVDGGELAAGLYFLRMNAGKYLSMTRIVLLK